MAKRRQKDSDSQTRVQTIKERRLRARQRERDRRFLLFGGIAAGLAALFVLIGVIINFIIIPQSTVLEVDGTRVSTAEFRKRYQLERQTVANQYAYFQLLQRQFANQINVQNEIRRLESLLSDAFTMGVRVKSLIIDDILIADAARAEGIAISQAELDEALEGEIAARYSKVTEAQATATILAYEELAEAAEADNPEPASESDGDAAETEEAPATMPNPPEVLTEGERQQGLDGLVNDLRQSNGYTLEEYRGVLEARMLRNLMEERIGASEVPTTEQRVRAQHILIAFDETDPDSQSNAETEPGRTEQEALQLAQDLHQRLDLGESFEYLVALYSDDPSKEVNQGNLGWFGPGQMVSEFQEAAFAMAPGTYSEPFATEFGYHIVHVLESDPEAVRDASAIQADIQDAFTAWLDDLRSQSTLVESGNLSSQLPLGAEREAQEFLNQ